MGELVHHHQPRTVRPQRERHRSRRAEGGYVEHARHVRRRAESHGRGGCQGSPGGAGFAEPPRAARCARVHPRRFGAAEHGARRPRGARPHGQGEHRHRHSQGRGGCRLHAQERYRQCDGELEGALRLLSLGGSGLRADLPHGGRQRVGLCSDQWREGLQHD